MKRVQRETNAIQQLQQQQFLTLQNNLHIFGSKARGQIQGKGPDPWLSLQIYHAGSRQHRWQDRRPPILLGENLYRTIRYIRTQPVYIVHSGRSTLETAMSGLFSVLLFLPLPVDPIPQTRHFFVVKAGSDCQQVWWEVRGGC